MSSQVDDFYLHGVTGYEVPEFRLFSGLEIDLFVSGFLRRMQWKRFMKRIVHSTMRDYDNL